MAKRALIAAILLLPALPGLGQASYSTVTATVVGANGQPYANAAVSAILVNSTGQPIAFGLTTPNGQPYQPKAVTGTLSASGVMTLLLFPTNTLTCPNSGTYCAYWQIAISAPTDSAILTYAPAWPVLYRTAVTGNVDLSSQINALAQSVNFLNLKTGQSTVSGGGGGSMTWPGASGIPCYSGSSAWCATYSNTNLIPSAYLNVFSTTQAGIVPVSPGGTSAYLRADATWSTPVNFADSETVAGSSTTWTLAHTPAAGSVPLVVVQVASFGGVVLIKGQTPGYTISGAVITTTTSYTAGALSVWYRW
jgi:hypothetical protein